MAIKLYPSENNCETQPPNEWPESPRANGSHSEAPCSRALSPPRALHLLRSLKNKSQDFPSSHNSKRFFETRAEVPATSFKSKHSLSLQASSAIPSWHAPF